MAGVAGIINRAGLTTIRPSVRLLYGGELPDPAGLLPRSGGRQVSGKLAMRSLKITTLEDVTRPELRSLVEVAVRHRVPPA